MATIIEADLPDLPSSILPPAPFSSPIGSPRLDAAPRDPHHSSFEGLAPPPRSRSPTRGESVESSTFWGTPLVPHQVSVLDMDEMNPRQDASSNSRPGSPQNATIEAIRSRRNSLVGATHLAHLEQRGQPSLALDDTMTVSPSLMMQGRLSNSPHSPTPTLQFLPGRSLKRPTLSRGLQRSASEASTLSRPSASVCTTSPLHAQHEAAHAAARTRYRIARQYDTGRISREPAPQSKPRDAVAVASAAAREAKAKPNSPRRSTQLSAPVSASHAGFTFETAATVAALPLPFHSRGPPPAAFVPLGARRAHRPTRDVAREQGGPSCHAWLLLSHQQGRPDSAPVADHHLFSSETLPLDDAYSAGISGGGDSKQQLQALLRARTQAHPLQHTRPSLTPGSAPAPAPALAKADPRRSRLAGPTGTAERQVPSYPQLEPYLELVLSRTQQKRQEIEALTAEER